MFYICFTYVLLMIYLWSTYSTHDLLMQIHPTPHLPHPFARSHHGTDSDRRRGMTRIPVGGGRVAPTAPRGSRGPRLRGRGFALRSPISRVPPIPIRGIGDLAPSRLGAPILISRVSDFSVSISPVAPTAPHRSVDHDPSLTPPPPHSQKSLRPHVHFYNLWFTYGFLMIYLFFIYVLLVFYSWFTYDILILLMTYLCKSFFVFFTYNLLMIYLWYTYILLIIDSWWHIFLMVYL
jgi:hypothetical protein